MGSTPKSSIKKSGFSIRNHLFWGTTIFGNTHIYTNPFCQLENAKNFGQSVENFDLLSEADPTLQLPLLGISR